MIDYAKLGKLIALLAPECSYVKVGEEKNVFGSLWHIHMVKMKSGKVFSLNQSFTELQLNEIHDAAVVADAMIQQMKNEIGVGRGR